MIRTCATGLRSGACLGASAALLMAFGPLVGTASAAGEISGEGRSPIPWVQEMGEYFSANPELKTVKGSGWKPYNRFKYFYEQRMWDGKPIPFDARWKAWQQKRSVEAAMPSLRANTWFSLGPTNFAGRMLSIDFDVTNPSIVYTGAADGGVWKSTDSGATWTPMMDELPSLAVGGVAVSQTDPNVIIACTGEATNNIDGVRGVGILRSTDGGTTWVTTSLTLAKPSGHGFHFAVSTANGVFVAGATDGLWRSTDEGATWIQEKVGDDYYDGVVSPLNADRIFVVKGDGSGGNNVKVSANGGATWGKAGTGQPASFVFGKSKLGISGTTVYCYIGDKGTGGGVFGIIKSTDDGATWTQPAAAGLPSGQSWYNLSCTADPNNANRVICGAVSLARSGDGGATFNNVGNSIHVDHHFLKYEPGSNIRVWAGSDGGVYLNTSDGGSTSWSSKNNGLVTYQFYDICTSNDGLSAYVMGGTQDNGTDRWTGTTTWANSIGADGMVCNIPAANSDVAYGEIQFGDHRKSTNRGVSFTSFNSGITGTGAWVTPVAVDPSDEIHLLTRTSAGIFRSTNGSSWSNVGAVAATWIDISAVNGNVAYAISGNFVNTTTDNGNTWIQHPIPGFGGGTKIVAHPTDVNEVWAAASGYSASTGHIAKSTDQGTTWTIHDGDLPAMPVNAMAIDPSNPADIYVGTDVGVWFTRNDGVNWYPVGDATFPNACVSDLEIRDADRKLVAGTHGRGGWELTIPATIEMDPTDAAVTVNPELRNLMLDRPWPNPASDRTLLRYAAKSGAAVSLRIYDVHGRMVSHLEDFSSGDGVIRTTPWFTDDVPSGVYFAVLEAGNVQKSRKITVIK